jgi:hypothetical protein
LATEGLIFGNKPAVRNIGKYEKMGKREVKASEEANDKIVARAATIIGISG